MSSISSIYAQSISKLYENSSTKASSSSSSSDSANTSAKYGKDTMTISEDGLSMLKSLMLARENNSNMDSSESSDKDNVKSEHKDVISQLKDLASSDKLSDDDKASLNDMISKLENRRHHHPYPMNQEAAAGSDSDDDGTASSGDTIAAASDTQDKPDSGDNSEDYVLNLEALVSSGFITPEQSDLIGNTYDMLNNWDKSDKELF